MRVVATAVVFGFLALGSFSSGLADEMERMGGPIEFESPTPNQSGWSPPTLTVSELCARADGQRLEMCRDVAVETEAQVLESTSADSLLALFLEAIRHDEGYSPLLDESVTQLLWVQPFDVCTETISKAAIAIDASGKMVVGYFDLADTGDVRFLGFDAPDWYRLMGTKLGCALTQGFVGNAAYFDDVAVWTLARLPPMTSGAAIEPYFETGGPHYFAQGTPEEIAELANNPLVYRMEWLGIPGQAQTYLTEAREVTGSLDAYDAGFRGSGSVAVYDDGFSTFNAEGYSQQVVRAEDFNGGANTDPCGVHGTNMAWIVHGEHATLRGYASARPAVKMHNAKILCGDETGLPERSREALERSYIATAVPSWQILVGSNSWGQMQFMCGDFDCSTIEDWTAQMDLIQENYDIYLNLANRLQVAAVGDWRDPCCQIPAPGTAGSVLTVGAVDDHNGQQPISAAEFTIGGRTADGLRKPDIVMPGVEIESIMIDQFGLYVGQSTGTSPATAAAAGAGLQSLYTTGTEKKCGLLLAADRTTWDPLLGWGMPNVLEATDPHGRLNNQVNEGSEAFMSVTVPAGKTLKAFVVWRPEWLSDHTHVRTSDLDLHLRVGLVNMASSTDTEDVVEGTSWTNSGPTSVTAKVVVKGIDTTRSTTGLNSPQGFSACWEVE